MFSRLPFLKPAPSHSLKNKQWGFPDGPMAEFHAASAGSQVDPWSGNKIPRTTSSLHFLQLKEDPRYRRPGKAK